MIGRWAPGAAGAALIFFACAGPPPDGTAEARGEISGEPLTPAVDARYLTHLLFASDDGTSFIGTFDQTAGGEDLRLDYDVRLYDARLADGDAWRSLVLTRDTVSVARAAWRLLPTPTMAIRVGDAGQVVSLLFGEAEGEGTDPVRLVAGEEVSVWTGPTGQRESLGMAALQMGDRTVPGILFFRRAARALSIPVASTDGRTFVFADSRGNGLVVHAGTIGQPAVANTWLHGVEAAWGEVTLEAPDPGRAGGSAAAWRFEISGTTVRGNFAPLMSEDPGDGTVIRMEATVYVGTEVLYFNGFAATLPSP